MFSVKQWFMWANGLLNFCRKAVFMLSGYMFKGIHRLSAKFEKWKERSHNAIRPQMQFGRLTVIKIKGWSRWGYRWLCECSCESGKQILVYGWLLKSGNTSSCGCLQREKARMQMQGFYIDTTCKECSTTYRTNRYKNTRGLCRRCNNRTTSRIARAKSK